MTESRPKQHRLESVVRFFALLLRRVLSVTFLLFCVCVCVLPHVYFPSLFYILVVCFLVCLAAVLFTFLFLLHVYLSPLFLIVVVCFLVFGCCIALCSLHCVHCVHVLNAHFCMLFISFQYDPNLTRFCSVTIFLLALFRFSFTTS